MKNQQYLGDGVYAQIDTDGDLVLTTGTPYDPVTFDDNVIYFNPQVLAALKEYIEKNKL